MVIAFEELRKLKDSLPHGSMERIASELNVTVQSVRNYFGATDFSQGSFVGVHYEPGTEGGVVMLDDDTIFLKALQILSEYREAGETIYN
ncbi:MAG: DNA-binding protein [Bacteroidota bacterium]|nr:DNA-binding protein [Bacteroidota bacterium]